MAYINKLININSGVTETNNTINTVLDNVNDAIRVNIVSGSLGGDGKSYLYSGDTTTPINETTISGKNGIDTNTINNALTVIDTNINSAFDNVNNAVKLNVIVGSSADGECYLYSGDSNTAITATGSSLNVNVSTNTDVSGTIALSNLFALDTTLSNLSNKINNDTTHTNAIQVEVKNTGVPTTGTFYQATQPVSGTVDISNAFTLETTLSTLNNKINSDNVNTDAIQIEVKNTGVPTTGTFYQATQPVSGTVALSNAFSLETTLSTLNNKINNDTTYTNAVYVVNPEINYATNTNYLFANIVANSGNSNYINQIYNGTGNIQTTATTNSLDCNIINASTTVSDSNIPANLTVDTNNLQVVDKNLNTTYNAGQQSIDINMLDINNVSTVSTMYNGAGDTQLTVTIDNTNVCLNLNVANPYTESIKLNDGSGNNIASTVLTSSNRGIDAASSIYIGSTSLTATGSSLNMNVNNSLTVSDTTIANVYDGATTSLKVNIVANEGKMYLYNGAGTNAITSTNVFTSPSTSKGIDMASSMYVSNGTTSTALTATSSALDVAINNPVTDPIKERLTNGTNYISTQVPTTNNALIAQSVRDADMTSYINNLNTILTTTTNTFSKVGINNFSIPPKSLFISYGGISRVADPVTGTIFTGYPATSSLSPLDTGYIIGANSLKIFKCIVKSGVTNTNKTLKITYCDSSNNLQTTTFTATSVEQTIVSNIINVIAAELTDSTQTFSTGEICIIYHTEAFPNITLTNYDYIAAWITIPAGYCGILRNFNIYSNSAETIRFYKYGPNNNITTFRDFRNVQNNSLSTNIIFLNAGETFFLASAGGTATDKKVYGLVELKYIL